MNVQIEVGAELLLSVFMLDTLSDIQQEHLESLRLQKKPNVLSWNRSALQILLDYSRALWKYRSEILHNESLFTQETMLRNQAASLLTSLRSTPYRLPMANRNLLKRSTEYLNTSHIRNVISWTNRVNRALEEQAFIEKTSSTDIRTWIYSGTISTLHSCSRLRSSEDTWYDRHNYDSDDSEMTVNEQNKFPDEADKSWSPNKPSTIRF